MEQELDRLKKRIGLKLQRWRKNDLREIYYPLDEIMKIVEPYIHHTNLEAIEKYSRWLEKHGYMDSDWYTEEPKAIDEFIKSLKEK